MKILTEPAFFQPGSIKIIENKMNATYVFESCLKNQTGGWDNVPVAVFYTTVAHPQGSNYFGVYKTYQGIVMIANAISATEPFQGVAIDGEIFYSRYRHDFREHRGVFVDGGRDYIKWGGQRVQDAKIVNLKVVDNHLEVI